MTPVRITLSRRKGFRLQETSRAINGLPAVKVDRATRYGNPFVVGRDGTTEECLKLYSTMLAGYLCLTSTPGIDAQKKARSAVIAALNSGTLKGKNLACWCRKDKPCHADMLLKVANQ